MGRLFLRVPSLAQCRPTGSKSTNLGDSLSENQRCYRLGIDGDISGEAHMHAETKVRLSSKQKKVYSVVRRRGTLADFARHLSAQTGKNVKWTTVWAWVLRGQVSRPMVMHVHKLTRAPLKDLIG